MTDNRIGFQHMRLSALWLRNPSVEMFAVRKFSITQYIVKI
ncbi:MAG: hypothetical protein OQK67_09210 [Chlorobium sp.]|nr:hypothetical protein [Chlorobium sp.]